MIDDSIRFSLARVSFGARHHHGTERERERERERKKERKTRRVLHTRQGHHHSFNGKRKGITREEESPLQPQKKKKKKIQKRDEFRFFCSQSSFLGHRFLLLLGIFSNCCFLSSVKISLKKKNGRQKRPPKHQLRLSTFLRYPIGRTGVVALSVSFSLSLSFL